MLVLSSRIYPLFFDADVDQSSGCVSAVVPAGLGWLGMWDVDQMLPIVNGLVGEFMMLKPWEACHWKLLEIEHETELVFPDSTKGSSP